MQIYLTKHNLITIGITIISAALFIIWGAYLMRDEPVETPVYDPPIVVTGSTTERYAEVFQTPLNPQTYPSDHKAVYEKVAAHIPFSVWYPTQIPDGYYLTHADAHTIYAGTEENNVYTITYVNKNENKIFSIEGKKGGSYPQGYDSFIIDEKRNGIFLEAIEGPVTLYVYTDTAPQQDGVMYRILSGNSNITKEELIEVGTYLESL